MASYRNGIYVAFNGMGTTDPTKSDMKYYALLRLWNESNKFDFSFSDSHQKTFAVRDSSATTTLKNRLLERFRSSKVLFLIVTENASINRGLLNWEIDKAVEIYNLPIIVCYPGYSKIQRPNSHREKWPLNFKKYVDLDEVKTIHIPFKKDIVLEALNDFSVHNPPTHTLGYYKDSVYEKYGIE